MPHHLARYTIIAYFFKKLLLLLLFTIFKIISDNPPAISATNNPSFRYERPITLSLLRDRYTGELCLLRASLLEERPTSVSELVFSLL